MRGKPSIISKPKIEPKTFSKENLHQCKNHFLFALTTIHTHSGASIRLLCRFFLWFHPNNPTDNATNRSILYKLSVCLLPLNLYHCGKLFPSNISTFQCLFCRCSFCFAKHDLSRVLFLFLLKSAHSGMFRIHSAKAPPVFRFQFSVFSWWDTGQIGDLPPCGCLFPIFLIILSLLLAII